MKRISLCIVVTLLLILVTGAYGATPKPGETTAATFPVQNIRFGGTNPTSGYLAFHSALVEVWNKHPQIRINLEAIGGCPENSNLLATHRTQIGQC